MKRMTDAEIQAIRARCDRVKPWKYIDQGDDFDDSLYFIAIDDDGALESGEESLLSHIEDGNENGVLICELLGRDKYDVRFKENNAKALLSCNTDVPQLLAEIDALKKENAGLADNLKDIAAENAHLKSLPLREVCAFCGGVNPEHVCESCGKWFCDECYTVKQPYGDVDHCPTCCKEVAVEREGGES